MTLAQHETIVFSHGKESGPWGAKIRSMADTCQKMGKEVISVDYQGQDQVEQRITGLLSVLDNIRSDVVLVGSSMGGYVAAATACKRPVKGAFLLAPAFFMPGYPDIGAPACPLEIVHGWGDEIVPVENSIRFARQIGAALHLLDGDHRLMSNLEDINSLLATFLTRVCLNREH